MAHGRVPIRPRPAAGCVRDLWEISYANWFNPAATRHELCDMLLPPEHLARQITRLSRCRNRCKCGGLGGTDPPMKRVLCDWGCGRRVSLSDAFRASAHAPGHLHSLFSSVSDAVGRCCSLWAVPGGAGRHLEQPGWQVSGPPAADWRQHKGGGKGERQRCRPEKSVRKLSESARPTRFRGLLLLECMLPVAMMAICHRSASSRPQPGIRHLEQ